MPTTPDLGIPELAQSQANPDVTHNEALQLIQALAKGVISLGDNAPPGSPTDGDAYVLGAAPTGAWAGRANCIAVRIGSTWRFIPGNDDAGSPIAMGARQEGLRVWVQDVNTLYVWTGSPLAWMVEDASLPLFPTGSYFIFEGDSLTAEWSADSLPDYIAALPRMAGMNVRNVATNGDGLEVIVTQYASQVEPYKPGGTNNPDGRPAVLSLWVGAADFWQFSPGSYADADAYADAVEAYLQNAKDDGFVTVAWTVSLRGVNKTVAQEAVRRRINERLRSSTVADYVVDVEHFLTNTTDTTWYDVDGVHMSAKGRARLAKLFVEVITTGGYPRAGLPRDGDSIHYGSITATGARTVGTTPMGFIQQYTPSGVGGQYFGIFRDDPTPSDADVIGGFAWYGRDSALNEQLYASFAIFSDVVTSGAENGRFVAGTFRGGALNIFLQAGNGIYHASSVGTDQGAGTINFVDVYDNGVNICAPFNADMTLDDWNALVPTHVIPAKVTQEKIKTGKILPAVRRTMRVDGKSVEIEIEPAREEIVWADVELEPERTERRAHRTARRHFELLASGFNPHDANNYVTHMREHGSLPGMPNVDEWRARMLGDNMDKFSIGERNERLQLAVDYLGAALADTVDRLTEIERQLAVSLDKGREPR